MTTDEMLKMLDDWMATLRPLYLQLHTWAKYKLAEKFHQPVPKKIPAHWINNRWAQEWPDLVEAANIDKYFEGRKPEWIIKTAEQFYTGLGFSPLPQSFWEKSDLYPVPPDSKRKKNTHASCWHIDLENDIRSLAKHRAEFALVFHCAPRTRAWLLFQSLLASGGSVLAATRRGAWISRRRRRTDLRSRRARCRICNRAAFCRTNSMRIRPRSFWTTRSPARFRSFISPAARCRIGKRTSTRTILPADQWNARWWKYVSDFQGIEPPSPRGEEWCDAATKTHINDNPAYYYNYAFATVFKFQLHDYIARKILHQPPQSCNYADNKEVGAWLNNILKKGGTEDWRKVLKEATGEDISTRAMMEYFKPLMSWLEEQNKGRQIGWD